MRAPGTPPGKASFKEWQRASTADLCLTSGPNRESQISVAVPVVVVAIFRRVTTVRDQCELTFLLGRKRQPGLDLTALSSYLFSIKALASSFLCGEAGCLVGRHQGDCDMPRIRA